MILQSWLSRLAFSNFNWRAEKCTEQWWLSYLEYLTTWWPTLHISHARKESCTTRYFLVTHKHTNHIWEDILSYVSLFTECKGPAANKLQFSFATWALKCFLPKFLLTYQAQGLKKLKKNLVSQAGKQLFQYLVLQVHFLTPYSCYSRERRCCNPSPRSTEG